MLRDGVTKVEADGSVSGEILFLKLDKKRHILDMARLPFTGTFHEKRI